MKTGAPGKAGWGEGSLRRPNDLHEGDVTGWRPKDACGARAQEAARHRRRREIAGVRDAPIGGQEWR